MGMTPANWAATSICAPTATGRRVPNAAASRAASPAEGQFRHHSTVTPTVSVVIPALNEAANLPFVLERIPRWVHEVVVVDGHLSDDTVKVARAVRPDVVIVYQTGRGKGNAIVAGAEAATGDIVVLLDADGSTDRVTSLDSSPCFAPELTLQRARAFSWVRAART